MRSFLIMPLGRISILLDFFLVSGALEWIGVVVGWSASSSVQYVLFHPYS